MYVVIMYLSCIQFLFINALKVVAEGWYLNMCRLWASLLMIDNVKIVIIDAIASLLLYRQGRRDESK